MSAAMAEDEGIVSAMSKFKIFKDIVDIMQNPELKGRRETGSLIEQDQELMSILLLVVGRTASKNQEAASMFVKASIHLQLLDLIKASLEDADALRLPETWLTIGERVQCISGLCKDSTALVQAIENNFLERLVVILQTDGLPLILISTTFKSLLQILRFAVPPHYSEAIDPTWKKQALLDGTHRCIKESAALCMIQDGEEWEPLNDHSGEEWMKTRDQINQVLGGVVPLLEYLGGSKYRQLSQKYLGEIVPLARLTHRQILDVMAAVVEVLAFFGERATKVNWTVEEVVEKESEGFFGDSSESDEEPVIQKTSWLYCMDKDAHGVCTKLNDANRDGILFDLLQVPDDDVKLAAVTTLSLVPLEEFDMAEVGRLVKMCAEIEDVTAGRSEDVIAILLNLLTKFALKEDQQGMDFRKRHKNAIFVVMDILKAMTANDQRSSENGSEEKARLCDACIAFLQACSQWKEAPQLMRSKEAITAMKLILLNEDRCGDESHPAMIESTAVGGNAQSLLKALLEQDKNGSTYARLVHRLSALMEGDVAEKGYPIEVESALPPCGWHRIPLTAHNDPEAKREARVLQQKLFFDASGFKNILEVLFPPLRKVKKLLPRGLVDVGLAEAERFKLAKENAILEQDSDNEDNASKDAGADDEDDEDEEEEEEEEDLGEDEETEEEVVSGNPHLSIPYQKTSTDLAEPSGRIPQALRGFSHARTFAAAMRVFLSLLWYGEPEKRRYTWETLREPGNFQNLLFCSMQAEHYTCNLGAKVTMLAQELLRLPADQAEEDMGSIGLYESAVTFMCDALCGTIQGTLRNTCLLKRLQEGGTLTSREECLMEKISELWAMMARQIGWVEFSEDDEIDEYVDLFVGTELFDIRGMNVFICWQYYDQALKTQDWGFDKASLMRRDRISRNISVIMASFLRNSEAYKFDILVHMNRLRYAYDVRVDMVWLCEMLAMSENLAYDFAIARYILKDGHTQEDDVLERTVWFGWCYQPTAFEARSPLEALPTNPWSKIPRAKKLPQPVPRLVVCTNRAIYIYKPPWREPCTVCSSDKFCPEGPVYDRCIEWGQVSEIVRGFAGAVVRIIYEETYMGIPVERCEDLLSLPYGQSDELIQTLLLGVGSESEAHVTEDDFTWKELSTHVNGGALPLDLDEINEVILLYTPVRARYRSTGPGLGEPMSEWSHMTLVLTCSVPAGTQVQERRTDYKGALELTSIYGFQMNLARFLHDDDDVHQQLWKCGATPGEVKISPMPEVEQPILLFVMKDFILEAHFGSTVTADHWMRSLIWYTDCDAKGTPAVLGDWEFKVAGAEEEEGKGKKGKKKK